MNKEYHREYRKKHKEKLENYAHLYYLKNKERINNKRKKEYQKNKEKERLQGQDYYQRNKEKINLRVKNYKKKETLEFQKLKEDNPCFDCGIYYPYYVMDFDHVTGIKTANVSKLACSGQTKKLYVEISKCELVCSNCHRFRTWRRNNNVKLDKTWELNSERINNRKIIKED